jgi:hypothetical protein
MCDLSMKPDTSDTVPFLGIAHSSPEESQGTLAAALFYCHAVVTRNHLGAMTDFEAGTLQRSVPDVGFRQRNLTSLRARAEISQRDGAAFSGAVPTSNPYGLALPDHVRLMTQPEGNL